MIQYDLIRATGVTALILFTTATVLGLIDRSRLSGARWPRFVIDRLHRNVSLVAVVFLAIHVISTALDHYVSIPLLSVFVPFTHSYSSFWLGLGALASDLMLAIIITSLLRARLGVGTWRAVHWLAYVSWPVAVAHGIGEGSDTSTVWLLAINALCILAVLGALAVRVIRVPRLEAV